MGGDTMNCETLLHIDEALDSGARLELLTALGNPPGGLQARHQTEKPHLLFVAYDHDTVCPHDLVEFAGSHGFHAHLVDF